MQAIVKSDEAGELEQGASQAVLSRVIPPE